MELACEEQSLREPVADPKDWLLEGDLVFLNHGSFGACPRPVLEIQRAWRDRLERQPLQFLVREVEPPLEAARTVLAQFVGADPADLVFVPNATHGVNTVLRSLTFRPGDELLVTNQEYNACRNALNYVAELSGAQVVVAEVPFPLRSAEEVLAPIWERVTPRTRLVLVDHVTSQTGMVMPLAPLVAELNRRGVETLIDGAHAPGMVPLDLARLGATYYTGNCHKWLCTPKGVALLYVRRDRQPEIRPLTISHGANSNRTDRSRFQLEFGWQGTFDPSAYLSVPEAIRFMGSLRPDGWPAVMAANRALALAARKVLCASLGGEPPCPDEFIGSLATVRLPDAPANGLARLPFNEYPLQDALREKHRIEVPVISWPVPPHRLLRISAQVYNSMPQYEYLAKVLAEELRLEAFKA
jgi:isopenicillin-N epimerase